VGCDGRTNVLIDTKWLICYNTGMMYKLITKTQEQEFDNLDLAMDQAKALNEFVTIVGNGFEIVGRFGVDSVRDGKCPDGIAYDWNKAGRIGRVKKERK
jgi:hypothetical protein